MSEVLTVETSAFGSASPELLHSFLLYLLAPPDILHDRKH